MQTLQSSDAWLATATDRLQADGFSIARDVSVAGQIFGVVAHRSRFEWSKFGNAETWFVFGEVPVLDPKLIRLFSATAFQYAMQSKSFPLPCGLGNSVYCFAVCITDVLSDPTALSVRNDEPTKHVAAMEIPVVYERGSGKLSFFEKTPLWGAAYYKSFRDQIRKYLAPESTAS